MIAADLKALHAAGLEGWSVAEAMIDECSRLLDANAKHREELLAQGDKADPVVVAITLTVSQVVERLSAVAERAMIEGGIG